MKIGILYNSQKSKVMTIEVALMGRQNFLILQNKEKVNNENAPDYNVMMQVAGKLASVGGIWDKVSAKGVQYKSLTVEHPFAYMGKLHMAIFDVKEPETFKNSKGVDCSVTHTVTWSAPLKRDNNNFDNNQYGINAEHDNNYQTPNENQYAGTQGTQNNQNTPVKDIPEIDVNDDEIPF